MAYKRSSLMTDTVIECSGGCVAFGVLLGCERRYCASSRKKHNPPYSGPVNPRVRRLIVSGVLGGLVLIVVLTAAWNWLR